MDRDAARRLLCAALGGVMWGLGVGRTDALAALGPLGAPLVVASGGGSARGDAARGLLAGLLWNGLAFRWLPDTWTRLQGGHGLAAWAALVLLEALPVALLVALGGALSRRLPRPAGWALAGLAVDLLGRAVQPLPAGPSLLLAHLPALAWPAALGGRALASGVLLGLAAMPPLRALAGTLALAAVGGAVLSLPTPQGPVVGLVQPDIGAFDGSRASTADDRAARALAGVDAAVAEGATLVVLPETAWPFDPGDQPGSRREAFLAAWQGRPPTLLGAAVGREDRTNSLLALTDGRLVQRFDKRLRVPFVERRVGPWGEEAFRAGDRPRRLDLAGIRFGPLICYEDAWPSAVREAAAEADLLLAATNDAWTEDGAPLHLAAARLAALEGGRAVLRVATSGPSAVIDRWGRLLAVTPWVDGDLVTAGHRIVAPVPLHTGPRGSDAAPFVEAIGLLLTLGLLWRTP